MERYIAQFDSEGIAGTIKLNGQVLVSRDGKKWVSGGSILNHSLKAGDNVIEVSLHTLPDAPVRQLKVIIGTQAHPLLSIDSDQSMPQMPFHKTINVNIDGSPLEK